MVEKPQKATESSDTQSLTIEFTSFEIETIRRVAELEGKSPEQYIRALVAAAGHLDDQDFLRELSSTAQRIKREVEASKARAEATTAEINRLRALRTG